MAIRRVSVWHLRHLFNHSGYWRQVQNGQITARVKRSTHPTRPEAKQPFCTSTQTVSYLDAQNSELARVHQYLLPDGITLGGHGYPDPKEVVINGVKYAAWLPPSHWAARKLLACLEWLLGIPYKLCG